MNWIKSNPFVSALVGITVVICGLLFFVASKSSKKYENAKISFDEAYGRVATSEGIPLYPTAENRDAKKKALDDYRESINTFRGLFDKYRDDKIENIPTQAFTERLKASTAEVSEALTTAGCELPDGFFMGFEKYTAEQADKGATGILNYQLDGVKHAFLDLAQARPSKLIAVYREEIPEEGGGTVNNDPSAVTRKFAFEFTFKGSEDCARKFISALGETEPYYYIVRCIKIQNERDTPPRVSDAKFESPTAIPEVASPFGDNFFGAEAEVEAPVVETEVKVEEFLTPADSSKILAQVLGGEELMVFVRFDLTLLLPAKELPAP